MLGRNLLKSPRLSIIVICLGIACLVMGGGLLLVRYSATHGSAALPPGQTVNNSEAQPSEKKPSKATAAQYTVPAEQPRSIQISTLGINGLVQRVGVTSSNAMATPSNVAYAGWYVNGAIPGQPGLSIINGHVAGFYSDGIFKRLANIKPDATITVEYGNKTTKQFMVVDKKQIPEADSAAYLFTKRPGITSQLNLITCDGVYNKTTHSYNDRVIVVAELITP